MSDSGVTQNVGVEWCPVCLSLGIGAGVLGADPGDWEVLLMVGEGHPRHGG